MRFGLIFAFLALLGADSAPMPTLRVLQAGESQFVSIYIDGVKQQVITRRDECILIRAPIRNQPNRIRISRMGHPHEFLREQLLHYRGWEMQFWEQMPTTMVPTRYPCRLTRRADR